LLGFGGEIWLKSEKCFSFKWIRKLDEKAAELRKLWKSIKCGILSKKTGKPIANYVGARKVGNRIYISGKLPLEDGRF